MIYLQGYSIIHLRFLPVFMMIATFYDQRENDPAIYKVIPRILQEYITILNLTELDVVLISEATQKKMKEEIKGSKKRATKLTNEIITQLMAKYKNVRQSLFRYRKKFDSSDKFGSLWHLKYYNNIIIN